MPAPIRVTIWNEFRHERRNEEIKRIYPNGMHEAVGDHLKSREDFAVRYATLDQEHHGLSDELIRETDVMTWWGHMAHGEVDEGIVEKVYHRVMAGMGLLVLHSGHFSKIFRRLMGTTCNLKWREERNEREILWVTRPGHPIVRDIDDHFIIDHEEMYGEFFDVPEPQETVMISSFGGGEVFRSLCTWTRGAGKVVYFRPGHESFPTYYHPQVLNVIENAIRWAVPVPGPAAHTFGNRKLGWIDQPREPLKV